MSFLFNLLDIDSSWDNHQTVDEIETYKLKPILTQIKFAVTVLI